MYRLLILIRINTFKNKIKIFLLFRILFNFWASYKCIKIGKTQKFRFENKIIDLEIWWKNRLVETIQRGSISKRRDFQLFYKTNMLSKMSNILTLFGTTHRIFQINNIYKQNSVWIRYYHTQQNLLITNIVDFQKDQYENNLITCERRLNFC